MQSPCKAPQYTAPKPYFPSKHLFLPQNVADEGTTALRARLQLNPPEGRQKLRQASGAPNRKFPAAPAEASAGFELRKRPAKIQLPASNPPPLQRSFNGSAILLQSAAMYSAKTLFPQKHSFLQKHINCGETMPEFLARYEIAFSARARVCSGGVGEFVAVSPVRRRGKVFP